MNAKTKFSGYNLMDIRCKADLTQRELSELSGLSTVSISQHENGHTVPEHLTLYKYARALKCEVEDFYE